MPLSDEILEEIDTIVRGGFYDRERVLEIFREEMYSPGELPLDDLEHAVNVAFDAHDAAKEGWAETTDCDRLDAVFDALTRRGIIALQNAGNTQSDGYDDFLSAMESSSDPSRIVGYCFFHSQDLERAVRGGGLYLAFGPPSPEGEELAGAKVGRLVADELQRAGFEVVWDGAFDKRIYVPRIVWQRR